jgi:hypothetical protein
MMVRAPGSTSDADLSLSDVSVASDLSADGSTLVFGEYGDVESSRGGYLRPTSGGLPLRIGAELPLALSADGRHVLAIEPVPPCRAIVYATATGEKQQVPLGPIHEVLGAQWGNEGRLIFVGSARERPPRVWLMERGADAPRPLTPEGLFGQCTTSPDGRHVAFITGDGRCLVLPVDAPDAVQVVPGSYRDEHVCRFHANGAELFVRSVAVPIRVRRVEIATGRSTPHAEVIPPALGRKGVDAFVMSATGDAYAYSYGQETNRLYAMSRGE